MNKSSRWEIARAHCRHRHSAVSLYGIEYRRCQAYLPARVNPSGGPNGKAHAAAELSAHVKTRTIIFISEFTSHAVMDFCYGLTKTRTEIMPKTLSQVQVQRVNFV